MASVRRLTLIVVAAVSALAVAACGSSSTSGGSGAAAPAPLTAALSYFPSGTPLVATIVTDPHSSAFKGVEANTPDATLLKAGFFQEIAKLGINYNQDVKPLFGNPIALGIGTADVTAGSTPFLAAWQTNSATALKRLVSKLKTFKVTGHHDGATEYTDEGTGVVAVTGATVLISNDSGTIDSALDRHAANSGFSTTEYAQDTSGLPANSPVSLVGDLSQVLSLPTAAQALKIPWVAAIKGYGVTVDSDQKGATLHFRIDTTGRALRPDELPLASGTTSPGLAGDMPIQVGIHDPAQIWKFILTAAKTASPHDYESILKGEAKAKRDGVDIAQVANSLTGNLEVESDTKTTLARVPVSGDDTASIDKVLQNPDAGDKVKTARSQSLGGGLYLIQDSTDPSHPVIAGVVDNQLLVGVAATAAEVRAYAKAPTTQAAGSGAIAFKVNVGDLIKLAYTKQANPILQQLQTKLGDLTGSVQSSASALTGVATLSQK
jgi:hypothetical protein